MTVDQAAVRRAALLAALRSFFVGRGFVEVATDTASDEVIPELHIDLLRASELPGSRDPTGRGAQRWLRASPEMELKRLLCRGAGPVFEIGSVFRAGEFGPLHRPEFTMVEWYRRGDSLAAAMALTAELVERVAGSPPCRRSSYREAFERVVGLDPHAAPGAELARAARRLGVAAPEGMPLADRDAWLNLLLAFCVEPTLGADAPELLYHYPASQAALAVATTDDCGAPVAERFELYWRGVELANGYHELTDGPALRARLVEVNRLRVADGRPAYPLPERLLADMDSPGLPPCAGVALGFDRLLMLSLGLTSLDGLMG